MAEVATYEPIATTSLASTSATVTFSSIPSTYTDLFIQYQYGATSTANNIGIRFNGDTGSNYSTTAFYSYNTSKGAGSYYLTHGYVGNIALGGPTTLEGNGYIDINDYANTTTYKTAFSRYGYSIGTTFSETNACINMWRSTSSITSITLFSYNAPYLTGSTFSLYGIKAN